MMNGTDYAAAKEKWDLKSGFGNHRFILKAHKSDYVRALIPWRRHDDFYDKTGVRIRYCAFDSNKPIGTDEVYDILFEHRDRYAASVVFKAPVNGIYELYYMPFEMSGEWWAENVVYMKESEMKPDPQWTINYKNAAVDDCDVLRYESRTEFDSFYPMETVMTPSEKKEFFNSESPFIVVAESRLRPVRMKNDIPAVWSERSEDRLILTDTVARNEHYVFQIAVCAKKSSENIRIRFFDNKGNEYSKEKCFCINTYGIDPDGREMNLSPDISTEEVLPLWCCVDSERFQEKEIFIKAEISSERPSFRENAIIRLNRTDETLLRNGDDDLWRLSRLFWLNSKIGISREVIKPYIPATLNRDENTISILGKRVTVGDLGLPCRIVSSFNNLCQIEKSSKPAEILISPVSFTVLQSGAVQKLDSECLSYEQEGSMAVRVTSGASEESISLHSEVTYEADGFIDCLITAKAEKADIFEFRLSFELDSALANYMMGMCREGGGVPNFWEYRWNEKRDGNIVWLGGMRTGIQIKLMQDDDHWGGVKPVPASWSSGGGVMTVRKSSDSGKVIFTALSGVKEMVEDEEIKFHFHIILTPLHPVDLVSHFKKHYYHSNSWHSDEPVVSIDRALQYGADTVILHQGGPLNENINYPFRLAGKIKEEADRAHNAGLRYKIYYTVRELSNFAPEIWALRSLGDEIFYKGDEIKISDYFETDKNKLTEMVTGGPWLIEHLKDGYCPAWHQPLIDGEYDCAIKTQSKSRWHNYYLKGLEWLIEAVGIDGLYLDGIGYNRNIMRRLRRILNSSGKNTDIDIHLGNEHSKYYGYGTPTCEYIEHFAYADKVWIGEGYDYNAEHPDYFLTEVSGLPFGITSEMLEGGGNPWRGMVFGMTARAGWSQGGLTLPIWKLWDAFGISEAEMIGYWNPSCPVSSENDLVKATAFVKKDGDILIAVASWYPANREFLLVFDREKLGIKGGFELYAPYVESFQNEAVFSPDELIPIDAGKGWIFKIRKKD